MTAEKPNILFFQVDNLGMGELGCYGGGILRGADTKRMTRSQRGRQTHALCRGAAMHADPFGPYDRTIPDPMRNHTIALGGNAGGLVRWEQTIAEILVEGRLCLLLPWQLAHRG